MPPCGYRTEAISGLELFLLDNLDYFAALYRPKGLTPLQAIERERTEIAAIKSGQRGGPWAAITVLLNEKFYDALSHDQLSSWDDAMRVGRLIVREVARELASLSHDGLATA